MARAASAPIACARLKAVKPSDVCKKASAPFSRRMSITSVLSNIAANIRAVFPSAIRALTSAIADKREKLLPVASKFSLEEVADALREHAEARKTRVTVAWVTMAGVNTGADEARALAGLLAGVPVIINLIDVNDAREDGYKTASDAERRAFVDNLQILRAPVVRRYSGGKSKHAACGMLAGLRLSA